MNANTALKIRDAVEQAVTCGETEHEIRETFEGALRRSLIAEQERLIERAQKRIERLRGA
jgi:hypothetical protein